MVIVGIKIELAKEAARGRWFDILPAVTGISSEFLVTQERDCPKCGGKTRFKVFEDFAECGGAFCNQCNRNMADGFAVVQWANGCTLDDAITKVCQYLGVENELTKSPKRGAKSRKPEPKNNAETESKELPLEFIPWRDKLVDSWAGLKKPITPEAVKQLGGQLAKHYGMTVVAIPIIGRDGSSVGFAAYNASGGPILYSRSKDEPMEKLKIKLIGLGKGKGSGWIGQFKPGQVTIKTEGVSDMLAILSVNPDASVITNPFGAGENPLSNSNGWMLEKLRGETVYTVHDLDDAGREGALWSEAKITGGKRRPGWATAIAIVAKESKNLTLELTNGKDVRDFLNEKLSAGLSPIQAYDALIALASKTEPIDAPEGFSIPDGTKKNREPFEAHDDPHRLARVNLENYKSAKGGELAYWRDEWWKWKDNRWKNIPIKELIPKVNSAIKKEFDRIWQVEYDKFERGETDKDTPPTVRQVKMALVNNVIAAMASFDDVLIPSSVELQTWLDGRSKKQYLAMKNGILDIDAYLRNEDDVLIPHSPNWFSTSCLDYEFNVQARCPQWLKYIAHVMENDQQRIAVLQEFFGYLLYPSTKFQKFLALEGSGGNGKSVFLAAIEAVIGSENLSNVGLQNFGGQFDLYQTIGKMANICGDVGELDSVAEGVLKEYTGGGSMSFDRKNRDPITVCPTAKIILAWNNRPRFRDRSNALWRRMILVPFKRTIKDSEKVYGMSEARWWLESGEVPGILNWALVGLMRLISQNGFTESKEITESIRAYQEEGNLVRKFLVDHYVETGSESDSIKCDDLYEAYCEHAKKNGERYPKNSVNFGKELLAAFPSVKRDRKRVFGEREYHYIGVRTMMESDFADSTAEAELAY